MKYIKYRKLKANDLYRGFRDVMEIINPAEVSYNSVSRLSRLMNVFTYVGENDDNKIVVIGTLILNYKFGGHLGLIEDVAVLPEYKEQGIGKTLIKVLLYEAKKLGCYKVILLCKDNNVEFYEKCGMDKYQNCMVKKFI